MERSEGLRALALLPKLRCRFKSSQPSEESLCALAEQVLWQSRAIEKETEEAEPFSRGRRILIVSSGDVLERNECGLLGSLLTYLSW